MSLAELTNLRSLEDLPRLAVELGFEPSWHEVALDALDPALPADAPAAVVGRRGLSILLGVVADQAESLAERIAAALDRRGSVVLVAALEPARQRFTLAATVSDRPAATFALGRLKAIDLRILDRGRQAPADTPVRHALGWAEALSGRSLDRRFFHEFRSALDQATDALPGRIPRRDRHALALLDLTRVLFLYFVQDRGWLDQRPRFLREELDRVAALGRIERRLFKPLFFGTLNTPAARRGATARRFGRIPFLNGGLFEPRPIERRHPEEIPDEVWISAFDRMFERYHFTIAALPGGGAIGPDMLGRVFEGVMDPERRKETGAFYTPRRLVDQVVREGLVSWLAGTARCSRADAALRLEQPDRSTLGLIRSITVLDPAAGSGAFLVGALRQLVAVRERAGESAGAATRDVVARNLFGVDQNPSAVHLTELRLWLEVIQADPDMSPELVAPLPNLDALIRQGDSVFERIALPMGPAGGAEGIGALRRRVVVSSGSAKRAQLRALRRAETRAARAAIDQARALTEQQIREVLSSARAPELFGGRGPMPGQLRSELARLRERQRALRQIDRRLRETDALPWFHYPTQFADVMEAGGFQLVVMNPPWIRSEALSAEQRDALKQRYRWFRGGSGGRGFKPLPDLSVPFLERAVELTRAGGVVAGVFPAKLMTAQWGAAARDDLARRTTLAVAADLSATDHGFEASVYPMVLVAAKEPPPPEHWIQTTLDPAGPATPQEDWSIGPWSRGSGPPHRHPTIADRFRIRLGLKTGADRVFLDPGEPVEAELLRPALRGRDVRAFGCRPGITLLWTHDASGAPLTALPPLATRWLTRHRALLERRADHRAGPFWTLFRTEAATARHRVVWSDLGRDLHATTLTASSRRVVPLNTCYWIAAGTERGALALAAWLNSTPIRVLARERATVALAGFFRFNAGTVGDLPLPPAALDDEVLIGIAAEALRRGEVAQDRLDRRVAALLA